MLNEHVKNVSTAFHIDILKNDDHAIIESEEMKG